MSRISWIGVGNIGEVVCRNLALHGPNQPLVTAWNRTHAKAAELATQVANIVAASSIADAVSQSNIICLCLSDDDAVREVVDTVIQECPLTGKLFVDMSTIHPETASTQRKRLRAVGAEYIGSPIFGGVPLARNRQITLALAGSSDALAKFKPFTTGVICGQTICLEDKPCENAFMLKLIGNFIRFSAIATLGEAAALSEVVGLPGEALQQFVELFLQGPAVAQLQSLQAGEYHKPDKPGVPISFWVKESTHLSDIASRSGARLDLLSTLTRQGGGVEENYGSAASLLAIFGLIREQCGLPFEMSL